MSKAGIVVFPGSNCDRDCERALQLTGFETEFVWHRDTTVPDVDLIVLPGGFSYGDYLRAGAVAKVSPIMQEVKKFAEDGGLVLGICNGFQILLEVGLLPGAMTRNDSLDFICKFVTIQVESNSSPFTNAYEQKERPTIPIAHGEGNFRIDDDGLKRLQDHDQILFTYVPENPNGSVANIAGICNENRNVLGMMPHPERVADPLLGYDHGAPLFHSILRSLETS